MVFLYNYVGMNTEYFNSYFNYFSSCFSRRLKPGWGMKMAIFPFTYGAVIIVSMKHGAANTLEKRQESINLGGALSKTTLFSQKQIDPLADKRIGDTSVGIISITRYVIFKNDNESSWNEASAQADVETIIEKTKAKYGK